MSKDIQSPHFIVNADTVNKNYGSVVAAIKRKLKVGCSPSHARDIAASLVAKDYQTLKGLIDKDFYQLRLNVGSKANPFYVEKDIGFCLSDNDARKKLSSMLVGVRAVHDGVLLKNGEETEYTFRTTPNDKAYTLLVEVTGGHLQDLAANLAIVQGELLNDKEWGKMEFVGLDKGSANGFLYERFGSASSPNIQVTGDDFAIVDEFGWKFSSDDEQSCVTVFEEAGKTDQEIGGWQGELMLLERLADVEDPEIYLGENFDIDSAEFVALNDDGCAVLLGKLDEDFIDDLRSSDSPLHLFWVRKERSFS